jgi:AcrR family transcriptional regulator
MEASTARGRPRNSAIDARILGATREALARGGYPAVSMEAVAHSAGVGKQSLYRRWPRKPLLVFDAAFGGPIGDRAFEVDTGSLAGDIGAVLADLERLFAHRATTDVMRGILADALGEADTLQQLRERFIWPRLHLLDALIERGRARGEVGPDVSVRNIADAILGAMLGHYLIIGRRSGTFASELARLVARGVSLRR